MNFDYIYNEIQSTSLQPWLDQLPKDVEAALNNKRWGDLPKWLDALKQLPAIKPSSIDLNCSAIRVGKEGDCDSSQREELKNLLMQFHPWRKGPFDLFGLYVDTEWRSDLKWDRLQSHIAPLTDRLVLDVGCGSGYHCWRMKGAGARLALGIDPTLLYVVQFEAVQTYIQNNQVAVLPVGIDDMPADLNLFDTVFSMGLLYHRRAPLDHLVQLKSLLRDEGELVLETIVIDGKKGEALAPEGRYAKMANVWFIPTPGTVEYWLKRMGFTNIRMADLTKTTSEEQRVTPYSGSESLANFLDPNDSNLTIEGYPAPKRAVFLANNP